MLPLPYKFLKRVLQRSSATRDSDFFHFHPSSDILLPFFLGVWRYRIQIEIYLHGFLHTRENNLFLSSDGRWMEEAAAAHGEHLNTQTSLVVHVPVKT